MIAQELCLESQPGAGTHFMPIYDDLHPRVRHRLQTCTKNLCLACLEMRCYEPRDPNCWLSLIDAFEAGDYNANDRRNFPRSRREYEEEELYRLYGRPDRAPPPIYDPFQRSPRGYEDFARRSFQPWVEERQRLYDSTYARSYDEAAISLNQPIWKGLDLAQTPSYTSIDWVRLEGPEYGSTATVQVRKRRRKGPS